MRNRQPQLGRSLIVIIGFPFCRLEEEEEEEEEEVEVALRRKEAMPVPQRRTWETSLKSNNKFSVLANSEKV